MARPLYCIGAHDCSKPVAECRYAAHDIPELRMGRPRYECKECSSSAVELEADTTLPHSRTSALQLRGFCFVCGTNVMLQLLLACMECSATTDEFFDSMLVRPPEEMEECCVCAHLTPFIITMCKDGHRCCPACARQYFETNLGSLRYLESASRFTFNCFWRDCPLPLDDQHWVKLCGREFYAKFKALSTERMLIRREAGTVCPFPRCGNGIMGLPEEDELVCPFCSHEFCRCCRRPPHRGRACAEVARAEAAESAADMLASGSAKQCPRCSIVVEKSGGCDHMTCGCGAEWCWECLGLVERDAKRGMHFAHAPDCSKIRRSLTAAELRKLEQLSLAVNIEELQ